MLAVAGGKGGVGKTTTALGLASTLGRRGHATLVVDADCDMPNLLWMARLRSDPTAQPDPPDGLSALADGAPIEHVRYPLAHRRGVSVIPAGNHPTEADVYAALDRLSEWNGPVIVDCPAGAGRLATVPLRRADRTVLVSTPCPTSLCDTAKTAAMASALSSDIVGAVLTRCDDPPAGVRRLLDCPVLATIPSAATPLESQAVDSAYERVRATIYA
jgi:septum site-determining protein MinD